MIGAHLVRDGMAKITIDGKDMLDQIQHSVVGTSKEKSRPATEEEQTPYRSVIEKLFYGARLTSLVASSHASQAATKCTNRRAHHLKSLNATLLTITK